MNSVSLYKAHGSVLILTLMLVSIMTALSLAGLTRTNHQSQLAAVLIRQALLKSDAAYALITATRHIIRNANVDEAAKQLPLFSPGCPHQCDWQNAQTIQTDTAVTTAYIAQRVAPTSNRFLITARATHTNGSEAITHGLFDINTHSFHFLQ